MSEQAQQVLIAFQRFGLGALPGGPKRIERDPKAAVLGELDLADIAEVLLRQGEDHHRGLDLGQHGERLRIIWVDDVARIDLAEADPAIERGCDGRVGELGLRILDRALVGIDHRLELIDLGLLLIEALLGREVALGEIGEAREIFLR